MCDVGKIGWSLGTLVHSTTTKRLYKGVPLKGMGGDVRAASPIETCGNVRDDVMDQSI